MFLEEKKKYGSLREEFLADLQKRFSKDQAQKTNFLDDNNSNKKKSFFD